MAIPNMRQSGNILRDSDLQLNFAIRIVTYVFEPPRTSEEILEQIYAEDASIF